MTPKVDFYEIGKGTRTLTYSVICARFEGRWIFVRHQARNTWELPGGHIELGETPDDAAKRELYEEAGASPKKIVPICDYSVTRNDEARYGRLYYAEVDDIDPNLDFETVEVLVQETLPERLTYPSIQPQIFEAVKSRVMDL